MRANVAILLLSASLCSGAEPARSARGLVDEALATAKRETKAVLVVFGASWCRPCAQLEVFLTSPKVAPILATHFVVVHLTVNETDPSLDAPGGEELKEGLGGGKRGIPYFCFLDGDGRKLADSTDPDGRGFPPSTPQRIAAFDRLLQRVSPRMTAGERRRMERVLAVMAVRETASQILALRRSPEWRALLVAGASLSVAFGLGLSLLRIRRRRHRTG